MKTYSGRRASDGTAIVTRGDGTELSPRLDLHQDFKSYAIARLPEKLPWSIDEDYVRKIAGELARARLRVVSAEEDA